ncbi:hypothetical protein AB4072_02065 [Microvirga sp. 2MCAF38]|uniref:hypothetical protein n=1 Tax=Microvirga sp. 2MCAF38 TaxID=3232989 RepID=UPI003F96912C
MFSLFRIFIVVGVIFYLSPVRNEDALPSLSKWLGWAEDASKSDAVGESPARLETMWQALPDSAKQAILTKIMSDSGTTATLPKAAPPMDTLYADDRKAAWRGDTHKPRS